MRTVIILFTAVFTFALAPTLASAGANKPFVATTVQSAPKMAEQRGKIFVSPQGMRFEYFENGREMVKIVMPEKRLMRVLIPADKIYMEVQAPADTPMVKRNDSSPCPPVPIMTCTKVGIDKFGDMDVERWSQSIKDRPGTATLWWEPKRKMVVRHEFPDGRIEQLNLAGIVDFDGRKAEHWDISYAQPGGQVVKAYRLVDTKLGIIVKEQDPAGLTRELRDLEVVESDAAWFAVPEGFQRIAAPKPGAAPQKQ
ncbi:hypothetical protein ACFL12_03625 [Pseudomonadota bacterium]